MFLLYLFLSTMTLFLRQGIMKCTISNLILSYEIPDVLPKINDFYIKKTNYHYNFKKYQFAKEIFGAM